MAYAGVALFRRVALFASHLSGERDMDPSEKIKAWRHHLGMTQDEFAKASGISKATLVGYEVGQRKPGYDALAAIAETGCNINWLLTGKGEMRDVDREKALQAGAFRVIEGEARPLSAAEQDASTARRLEAIAQLVAGLESPREQAALLDEFLSRAQNAAEMHALKQAVAELRAAQKSA